MPDLNHERRPRWVTEGDKSEAGGRKLNTDSTENPENRCETGRVDLINLSPRERDVFWTGFTSGYCEGDKVGYRRANDEIATLQREAARIVHSMAGIPERDREADRARRLRREARWSA